MTNENAGVYRGTHIYSVILKPCLNHTFKSEDSIQKGRKSCEFITAVIIHTTLNTMNTVMGGHHSHLYGNNHQTDVTVSWPSTELLLYLKLNLEYFQCQLAHCFPSKEYKLGTVKWKTSFMLHAVDNTSLLWWSLHVPGDATRHEILVRFCWINIR